MGDGAAAVVACVTTCVAQASPPAAIAAAPPGAASPQRPESFWDDASVQTAMPGDLTPLFASFNATWGKRVLVLSAGEYLLPGQNAQVGILGHVRLMGEGVNVTYVHFRGYQKVFMIPAGSTFEHHNLTVTGITTGTYLYRTTAPIAGSKPLYATVYYINVEKWVAVDDLGAGVSPAPPSMCPANATGPCTVGYIAAIMRKIIELAPDTYLYGNDSDVVYGDTYIQYAPSKGYFWLSFKDLISLGYNTIIYYDVVLRNDPPPPRPDMQSLFRWFVSKYPGAAGSTECYNPEANDLGFTYRGTKSQSASGMDCIRWDDPRIQLNAFQPNKAGFSSVEANYCRNPRFFEFEIQGPWCNVMVDGEATYQPCGVPACNVVTPIPPQGSSTNHPAAAVAGGVTAAVVAALVALGLFWFWRRRRERRSAAAAAAECGDKIWHVADLFETVKPEAPGRYHEAVERAAGKPPRDVLDVVYEMLRSGISVPSLLREDLAFKYGPRWVAEHDIDTAQVLGAGAIGQVYAGSRAGVPVAFKVMNQMKPYPRMLRFIRKSILPVLSIQQLPKFPLDHPHLLPLIDCVMFPQWFALLEMGKEFDTQRGEWRSSTSSGRAHAQGAHSAHTLHGSSATTDVQKLSISTGGASASDRIAASSWTHASTSAPAADASPSRAESGRPSTDVSALLEGPAATSAQDSIDAVSDQGTDTSTIIPALALGNASGWESAPHPMFSFSSDVSSLGNGDNAPSGSVSQSESFARALVSTAPTPIPVASPVVNISSHLSDEEDVVAPDQERQALTSAALREMAERAVRVSPPPTAGSTAAKAIKPPRAGRGTFGERGTSDIVTQIIMVFPLCEVGSLSALIHGEGKLPMSALPQQMQTYVREHPKLGVCMTIDEHDTTVAEDEASEDLAFVTIQQLHPLWQSILKLQLALQIIDGVMALHAARLIHCDIKPDNIFLTASDAFEPFRICAKVGDMDTCRSLQSSRHAASDAGGASSRRHGRPLSEPASADRSIFTSALKGTPGFIAPEMLALGRVAPTTDVFSVAITVSLLLSSSHRMQKHDDMHMKYECEYPMWITQDVRQMLLRCHHADPASRPGLSRLRGVLNTQFQSLLGKAVQEGSL